MKTASGKKILKTRLLYENKNGSQDVTLTESAEHFSKLEIHYFTTGDWTERYFNYVKIDEPNNKIALLEATWPSKRYSVFVGATATYLIKENKITLIEDASIMITTVIAQPYTHAESIKIVKVIGYKN